MVLYMIGIGLSSQYDITLAGLEALKRCEFVYLESYTSKLNCAKEDLENMYNKKIIPADRELVESEAENTILQRAKTADVAFLVIGDIFSATTHTDLRLRAKKAGIEVKYVHNASILTVIGVTGLELYKFGRVASIPFGHEHVESPYNILQQNLSVNLHTLFLLDLRPDENKYLTIHDAISYLLAVEVKNKKNIFMKETKCVACARLGSESQVIIYAKASKLLEHDFGEPPYCLVVPSKLHFMEEEALRGYEK